MLASIFSKSRPINYVLIGGTLVLFYVLRLLQDLSWLNSYYLAGQKGLLLLLLGGTLFITGFITLKNTLTKANSYALLLFLFFLILFPSVLGNVNIIIANFFLLLALRRLISLQSLVTPKEKIFDASFWIFAASLFHFWCIIYIVLVFISVVFHVSRDYRNWIIPFIAFLAVAIIYFMIGLMVGHDFFNHILEEITPSFDFTYFENIYQNIALAIFASIAALFVWPYIVSIPSKPLNLQSSHKKILFSFFVGVGIYVLSAHKNNSFLAFTFAPLAIMGANYLESQDNIWVREIATALIGVIAIVIFMMQL
ncbi:DUF6427 family protein [Flavobacterium subsaxonicum]|uniref:Beta-carotene 15,15'-monooxygenase n=1 Tax=Flavobacterium subsaxonicum WB 4.1-42 = DSM 21790 TaxID=1121898 RepID=A0A0A2MMB7_9FLAO|nr:DUF6427 family protein [Flavobacterium subsaxonicum]KGO92696.1 hypothetical protein Q766_11280 [Flavobacterium subsaxonicum WB 4.1-42 = DSM 21790]